MKRLIVILLHKACGVRDVFPGSHHRLAYWSGNLDGRWGTGVWNNLAD